MEKDRTLGLDSPFSSTILLSKHRIRFPWVSGGVLYRRIPGKNGIGSVLKASVGQQRQALVHLNSWKRGGNNLVLQRAIHRTILGDFQIHSFHGSFHSKVLGDFQFHSFQDSFLLESHQNPREKRIRLEERWLKRMGNEPLEPSVTMGFSRESRDLFKSPAPSIQVTIWGET